MIHVNDIPEYNPVVLAASIKGVAQEIHDRQVVLGKMRSFVNHKPGTHFKRSTLKDRGEKAASEITVLKIIKAELVYLYELSKLKKI